MLLGLHTYSLCLHGIGQAWAGSRFSLENREEALRLELETIKQSIHFCRRVLNIGE